MNPKINTKINFKSFAIVAFLFMVFALFNMANVYATSVSAQPVELYETTTNDINLTVNNLFGDVITDLITTVEEFEIIGITEFPGWEYETHNDTIHWFDGTIEGNVFAALFQFTAQAPLVEEDTEVSFTVETDEGDYTTSITILNDDTPPELTNSSIEEEMMSKPIVLPVSVNVEDEETGVKEVGLNYQRCGFLEIEIPESNETNSTETNTTETNETEEESDEEIFNVALVNIGTLYSGDMDLTSYNNGDCICFDFEATNNALEVADLDGHLAIDEIPPTVSLTNEGVIYKFNEETAENALIFFDLEDNENACGFEGTFDCSMVLEEEIYGEDEYSAGEMLNMEADISDLDDGEYVSKIMCLDMAQNQGHSEDFTMIVDTTAPEMYVVSPGEPIVVEYNSSDNIIFGFYDEFSGLAEIFYSGDFGLFEEDISGYPKEYNMTFNNSLLQPGFNELNFVVEDGVENVLETTYEVCADSLAPTIELLNIPEELGNESNETQEYYTTYASNSVFEFSVDDDCGYLTCELYIDGEATGTIVEDAVLGNNTINTTLEPGQYDWSVVCQDQFGNTAESEEEIVIVLDDLAPVVLIDMEDRYCTGNDVEIVAEVTDHSELDSVIAEIIFDGDVVDTITLTNTEGNIWTGEFDTDGQELGDYIIEITAEDEEGNTATASHEFELYKKTTSGGGSSGGGSSGGSSGGYVYQPEEPEEEENSGIVEEPEVEEEIVEEVVEEEPVQETTSNSGDMNTGNVGVGRATGFLGGNFGSWIWIILAGLLVAGIIWYLAKSKGNLRKNDIGLEKYLNSRL